MRHSVYAADAPIPMKLSVPMENHMPMALKGSKSKPEVEFQYGGRLFLVVIFRLWIDIFGRKLVRR